MKPKHQIHRRPRHAAGMAPLMPPEPPRPETTATGEEDTEFIIKQIEARATAVSSILEDILRAGRGKPHWQ